MCHDDVFERVRHAIRTRHYSRRTERAYVAWVRRYLAHHGGRPAEQLRTADVARFLSSLAVEKRVSASTQNQAFSALLFLFRLCVAAHKRGYVAAAAMWCSGWSLLSVAGE